MNTNEIQKLLGFVRKEFQIPEWVDLGTGGGVDRIIGSTALLCRPLVDLLEKNYEGGKNLANSFDILPIKKISIIGAIISERPLVSKQEEESFRAIWELEGISAAVKKARINPAFRDYAHLLVSLAIEYCGMYEFSCSKEIHAKHFANLRPLRYVLHANT